MENNDLLVLEKHISFKKKRKKNLSDGSADKSKVQQNKRNKNITKYFEYELPPTI